MTEKTLVDIASQLEEPFPLEAIELLPKGKIERDGKTLCMGMPYADVRVYEDRLNDLACGEWSTPPCTAIVAGTKLLTYVTVIVCGVAHTDVGESLITSENGGTEAWAQGFKRACSQFGLGRYLYDLDKEWVPYNVQRKAIDLDAAGIRNIARKMYQKAGIPVPGQVTTDQNGNKPTQSESPAYREVYLAGGKKHLWSNQSGFYAFASAELGMAVSADNVKMLDSEQIAELEQAVEEEAAIAAK